MEQEAPLSKDVSVIDQMKAWYRALPDKKRYLEFLTALLTIPVLITIALSNIIALRGQKATPTPAPTTPVQQKVIVPATPTLPATPTPGPLCTKEVGPISIAYPQENTEISSDPVCLDIVRESGDFCSVVWSYRINASAWSDYTDKSICMYGLTPGEKKLELRVKSIVSTDEIILTRTFTVAGPTATPTPAPTP